MKPWDKQKVMAKESNININDIINVASEIKQDRLRSLFILSYLTAGRICELVRKNKYDIKQEVRADGKKVYYKYKTGLERTGILRKDIVSQHQDGRPILLISLNNEKNRKPNYKRKDIPIPLDRQENVILWSLIKDYIESLSFDSEIFPFGYQYAYKQLKQFWNPHWFRHIRLKHLSLNYNFSPQLLKMYAGWSDSRPADFYIDTRWTDILSKL